MSQPPFPQQPNPQFQQVPGQPTPPQQPVKPRKKWYQRVWVWILVAIVFIVIAANGNKGGDTTAGSTPSQAPTQATTQQAGEQVAAQPEKAPEKPSEQTFAMNQPVDTNDLQYTVTKVQKGVSKVGNEYLNQKAQGSTSWSASR